MVQSGTITLLRLILFTCQFYTEILHKGLYPHQLSLVYKVAYMENGVVVAQGSDSRKKAMGERAFPLKYLICFLICVKIEKVLAKGFETVFVFSKAVLPPLFRNK